MAMPCEFLANISLFLAEDLSLLYVCCVLHLFKMRLYGVRVLPLGLRWLDYSDREAHSAFLIRYCVQTRAPTQALLQVLTLRSYRRS